MRNYTFVDGQNLYLATTTADNPWRVDFGRFVVYLKEKYHVARAYYFIGAYDPAHERLYIKLQE